MFEFPPMYGVRILNAAVGEICWAVDGPGATVTALNLWEAGHWDNFDGAHQTVAWWRTHFPNLRVDVVRLTLAAWEVVDAGEPDTAQLPSSS